jgi:hypothetical protein
MPRFDAARFLCAPLYGAGELTLRDIFKRTYRGPSQQIMRSFEGLVKGGVCARAAQSPAAAKECRIGT